MTNAVAARAHTRRFLQWGQRELPWYGAVSTAHCTRVAGRYFQFLFFGSLRNRAASGSVGGRCFVNRLGGKLFTYFA